MTTAGPRNLRGIPSKPGSYETYREEQGIPTVYGVGLHDLTDLPLKPWKRMEARGCFIQLDGMEGITGGYALEIPAAGVTSAEKHLYEEFFYAVSGRGSTEVWQEGESRRQSFEWQAGSLFAVPLNAWHRLINSTSSPALLVSVTTAPIMMDLLHNADFIFNNPIMFRDRYDGSDDYFSARPPERDEETGRLVYYSNIIPDVVNAEMPLDGARGPGFRYNPIEMADNTLAAHLGEFPSGHYSVAHAHFAGAVLICLKGEGYTVTWPAELGTRPYEAGLEQFVKRQDYVPYGLVSPGTGWFHQHFSTGKEPLRQLAIRFVSFKRGTGFADIHLRAGSSLDIKKGGHGITYQDEDPRIRKDYQEALRKNGVPFTMPEEVLR